VCALLTQSDTQICDPLLGQYPFMLDLRQDASGKQSAKLTGNYAHFGGGALFAWCILPTGATRVMSNAVKDASRSITHKGFALSDNAAGYGSNVATPSEALEALPGVEVPKEYKPGAGIGSVLRIRDSFGQTVRQDGNNLPFTISAQLCRGDCASSQLQVSSHPTP